MMSESLIPICASGELAEAGKGIRFPVTAGGGDATGFVVRFDGAVVGYLNRCAHVPIELDWNEGEFFESDGQFLMCSTHGALYHPASGQCVGGPCRGRRLRSIIVLERDGTVFWEPDDFVRPARA